MDAERFKAMVDRLSAHAEQHPRLYKLEIFGLAVFGYLVLILIVSIALILGVGTVIALLVFKAGALLKIAWIPLWFAWAVLRAMWIRVDAPEGRVLTAKEAPKLFSEIDAVRRALAAPRLYRVLLTDEFNAAVSQVPRLGMFGWQKNYLIIGLPLMLTLSPGQFRAVLAHEFGHLSRNHSRFSAWIYRVRLSWARLLHTLDSAGRRSANWLQKFLNWYAPYFSAYSFVLARANEYEADRYAAVLVSAQQVAEALVNVEVKAETLHKHVWDQVYKQADRHPAPPRNPYDDLRVLAKMPTINEADAVLKQAFARETGFDDTHPSLRDRVRALGLDISAVTPVKQTAAEQLFGPKLTELLAEFNAGWRERIGARWQERHEYVQQAQKKLSAWDAKAAEQLPDAELFEYASLIEEFRDAERALALYQALIARNARHAGGVYAVGRMRLAKADEGGVAYLHRAMEIDHNAIKPACELLFNYYRTKGNDAKTEEYRRRWNEQDALYAAARLEREQLLPSDNFVLHDVPAAELPALVDQLRAHRKVRRAQLVRKELKYFPESPLYVLAIKPRGFISDPQRLAQKLANELKISSSVVVYVFGPSRKLNRRINKVKGACIYKRAWWRL